METLRRNMRATKAALRYMGSNSTAAAVWGAEAAVAVATGGFVAAAVILPVRAVRVAAV